MTFTPTLFKFAIAAVHPLNTDSFFRMTKESYTSCRQIVENGGSLELYLAASLLNKRYCEDMYHTTQGKNDLSNIGVTHLPYHIGYYPIFDPALMVIFGPEFYNYWLYKVKWSELNETEKRLFINSHKLVKGGLVETMAEFEEGDTILGGLMRIEANIGPTKQLQRIQGNAPYTKAELKNYLVERPLLLITKPKTHNEIILKIVNKLYTTGSAEALKNISASIYYGRVAASVSANAYYIPNGTKETHLTYRQCLEKLIETETEIKNFDDHLKFIYPRYKDYDIFLELNPFKRGLKLRNVFEIQTIQKLTTHKIYTKLTQPVSSLLEYKWESKVIPEHLQSKVGRDFNIIKEHYPLIEDSLAETKSHFSGNDEEKTTGVLLLLLKLFSLKDKSFKGVIYGSGSYDVRDTYRTLSERNLYSDSTTDVYYTNRTSVNQIHFYNKIYLAYNQHLLSLFSKDVPKSYLWTTIDDDELSIFFQDKSINVSLKKRILMSATSCGKLQNVEDWSGRSQVILHFWKKRQVFNERNLSYRGDFILILFSGNKQLVVDYHENQNLFELFKTNLDEGEILFEFIKEVSGLIDRSVEDITKHTYVGDWELLEDKIVKSLTRGFQIRELHVKEPNIILQPKLSTVDDRIILTSYEGTRLYTMDVGLIEVRGEVSSEFDFKVFGLKFSSILSLDAFSVSFNVLYLSKERTLAALEDIEVNPPEITQETKSKLKLYNWEYITNRKDDESTIEIQETNLYEGLLDINESEFDLSFIEEKDESSYLVDFIMGTDLMNTMRTTQKIAQYRRVFNIIKTMKYDLICHHVLSEMRINSSIISSISKTLSGKNKKFVLYSVISFYDRMYGQGGYNSPIGIILCLNQDFCYKFRLNDEIMDIEITFE